MFKRCVGATCLMLLTAATTFEVVVEEAAVRFGEEERVELQRQPDGWIFTLTRGDEPLAYSWAHFDVDATSPTLTPLWQMSLYDGEKPIATVEEVKKRGRSHFNIYDPTGGHIGTAWQQEGMFAIYGSDGTTPQGELGWPKEGSYTVMEGSVVDPQIQKILLAALLKGDADAPVALHWSIPAGHEPGYRVVHTQPGAGCVTIVGYEGVPQHISRQKFEGRAAYVTSDTRTPKTTHECTAFALFQETSVGGDLAILDLYSGEQHYLGYLHHYWTGTRYRIDLFNSTKAFLGSLEWSRPGEPITVYQVGDGWRSSPLEPCMNFSRQQMQIQKENRLDERVLRLIVGYVLDGGRPIKKH